MNNPDNRLKGKLKGGIALLFVILLLTGCEARWTQDDPAPSATPRSAAVDKVPVPDIADVGMIEDKTVYAADNETSVVCFYVTVRVGDEGSGTDHTFAEVNSVVRFKDNAHFADDVYARALVQVGDENGPTVGSLGFGQTETNATIRVRGNSSSAMPQKSYKLKLDDSAGLWRGQRNIALNKSIFDETRFRNKLYFDMLRDVEHISSIRTQFVHLYVKDETSGQTAFQDYGLFTQAEVPGSRYLMNHGLDKEGYLYKAIAFNFEPHEELRDFYDPAFDQAAFDTILKCKGRQDNSKLINLINMINDTSIDINDIIGPYIDRDNYITWLAYNLLTANIDTTVQNFYLYSPTNSDKWFFIPWDGDNMLPWNAYRMEGIEGDYGAYQHGISNYWGLVLHQRFLKYEENRADLAQRVDELHEIINKETVDALAKKYNAVTEEYALRMPDFYYLGKTAEQRMEIVNGLGDEIETAYREFHESLTRLMPFFLQYCEREGDTLYLNWDEAYAFDFAPIHYRITVSHYPDLRDPLVQEETDVNFLSVSPRTLPSGTYYWSVSAFTDDGRTAEPMNKISVNDVWYPGVDYLEVP